VEITKRLLGVHYNSRVQLLGLASLILAICFAFGALVARSGSCARVQMPMFTEAFDPQMRRIESIDEAVDYIRARHPGAGPVALADAADELVRHRFFHGYSAYRPCQDWIAYLAGYLWSDLRNPVLPDDILKFRRAACSQQAIVFQQIVRRLGLDFASVRAPGHFASAVKLDGTWYVYDADKEIAPRKYPYSALVSGAPVIERIYGDFGGTLHRAALEGRISLTDIDRDPAPRAALFHRLSGFLSAFGWLVFGALFALIRLAAFALPARRRHAVPGAA
jgi:hypothetical protein